jgi:hypothetical protein
MVCRGVRRMNTNDGEEEGKDMALPKEAIKQTARGSEARKQLIRFITNKACDRYDDALRRLAKS